MTAQPLFDEKQKSLQAFHRDLPDLYRTRPAEWVAYQGDRQLGFALRKHELYQRCFAQGLAQDEFVIFCIEPQEAEITLGPIVID